MTDYLVTVGPNGADVTLWEVEDGRLGIGPSSLPLLTVSPTTAREIAERLMRVAGEVER